MLAMREYRGCRMVDLLAASKEGAGIFLAAWLVPWARVWWLGVQVESLILAQNERWRRA